MPSGNPAHQTRCKATIASLQNTPPHSSPTTNTTTFTLPEKIAHALAQANIAYTLASTDPHCPYEHCDILPQIPAESAVRLLILQDSIGQEQFILPTNRLIDVGRLSEQNGRNLQAAPAAVWRSLITQQGLPEDSIDLVAVPHAQQLPLHACPSLRKQDRLYLSSGVEQLYLKLTGENVERYLRDATDSNVTVSVDGLWKQLREDKGDEPLIEAVSQFTTLRMQQRLDKTLEIPPMPETARRIVKLRVNPNATANDLAAVVEHDPSLAAQVVSWAASPYYYAPGGIHSVRDAVVRVLGFDLVMNLALGLAIGKTIKMPTDGPHGVTPYWRQAVFTAAISEALVKRMACEHRPDVGLAYLCGLLNNFGVFILSCVFPPFFSLISRFIEANPHHPHAVVEQYVLGISREHLCAWVMQLWEMPDEVVTALRWQQIPEYSDRHNTYANLLYVANQLTRRLHTQHSRCGNRPQPLPSSLLARLGLTPESVEDVLSQTQARQDELMAIVTALKN